MSRRLSMAMLPILFWWMASGVSDAQSRSREEVEDLWERLLREERYEVIEFLSPQSSAPTSRYATDNKVIKVVEGRAGYLWGLFGFSDGGGWAFRGQLEAEINIRKDVLQLYSKETIRWRPGLAFIWMPSYDWKRYPLWEFRLIARHPTRRQHIRVLKSVILSSGDVLPTGEPDGTSVKELIGQRIPRGELRYDASRHAAVVQILGLHRPVREEVSIPSLLFPDAPGH